MEGLTIGTRRLARAEAAASAALEINDETAKAVLGNIYAIEEALSLAGVLVPPPAAWVEPLMEELASYLTTSDHPALVQAAVAHVQFETIHPFPDGNGRAGRALIQLVLRRRGVAPTVVPPVSLVLATRAREFIAALVGVRETDGNDKGLLDWVDLFVDATGRACGDTQEFAATLATWDARMRARAGRLRAGSAAAAIVDGLPALPTFTAGTMALYLSRPPQKVNEAVARLVDADVIRQVNVGRRRNRAFEAVGLFDLFDRFTDFERGPAVDEEASPRPVRRAPARTPPSGVRRAVLGEMVTDAESVDLYAKRIDNRRSRAEQSPERLLVRRSPLARSRPAAEGRNQQPAQGTWKWRRRSDSRRGSVAPPATATPASGRSPLAAPVRVRPVLDHMDHDALRTLVDLVDHPIVPAPGHVQSLQLESQRPPDAVRILRQRSVDQFDRRRAGLLREQRQRPSRGRGPRHFPIAHSARLVNRAASSLLNATASSRSARDARTCASRSGSDITRSVSSKESRSSVLITTAAGRPCLVIVTRACCDSTCSTTSDRRFFTSANGNCSARLMAISMAIFGWMSTIAPLDASGAIGAFARWSRSHVPPTLRGHVNAPTSRLFGP